MTLSPGTHLGHYEILSPLGKGGMGEVYRAQDHNLDRIVAIKVLPENVSREADALQRFDREVRAIAALNDRHILTIHDYGDHEGRRYAVTELLEGETLADRMTRKSIEWGDALDMAIDVARGLAAAHKKGVIHRDIKPSNIFITNSGAVKILDFGLACSADPLPVETVAPGGTLPLHTTPGTILGTVGYMSPEQARGEPVDPTSDIFSFGCVFFEMLTGKRPFQRQTAADTLAAILNADAPTLARYNEEIPSRFEPLLARCLNKGVDHRFPSGSELAAALIALKKELTPPESVPVEVRRKVNKPAIGILVVSLLAILAWGMSSTAIRRSKQNLARKETLPEIERLSNEGKYSAALKLAKEAMDVIPEDSKLLELVAAAQHPVIVESDPRGASVYYKDFDNPEGDWLELGKTPLQNVVVPRGLLRWMLELEGYQTVISGMPSVIPGAPRSPLNFTLEPEDESIEGMVYVPPGFGALPFNGFDPLDFVVTPGYHIDQYEVSNADYLEFVEQAGYENPDFWQHAMSDDEGRLLTFDDAMERFVDTTGRPGPSTWELGRFNEGEENLPVTGLSWYEAAAYAAFRGKHLPTMHQWGHAALSPIESGAPVSPNLVPLSNFDSEGLRPNGDLVSLSPSGAVNLAGNAREWCWTEEEEGRRYILGGAWDDPTYMLTLPNAISPLDRSAKNGFRCVQYPGSLPQNLLAAIPRQIFNFEVHPKLSEDGFRIMGARFRNPPMPLTPEIEATDDTHPDWILEEVTVDCTYDESPFRILVYLPRSAAPPYQAVVYYPGADAIFRNDHSDIENFPSYAPVTFLPRSGRALIFPIYWGTFGRAGARRLNAPGNLERGGKDLERTLEYLRSRSDIDIDRLAYLGFSMGSIYGNVFLPYRPEFKAAILVSGGLAEFPNAEGESISGLIPYITLPTLTLNGKFDYLFPPKASQEPFFNLIGTPAENKKRVVYEAGHWPLPRNELIRETLDWLDKYLGPVQPIDQQLAEVSP